MGTTTFGRTPYWVLTGGLAVLFLFPIVWSAVASVSPSAGSSQVYGYGFGNYVTLANFGTGLPRFAFNSAVISILTVCLVLTVSTLGGYAFARFSFPGKNLLFLATLAILGNHDYWAGAEQVKQAVRAAGVTLLGDSCLRLEVDRQ